MRLLLAVAFVIVTSVAAFTYRDLLLAQVRPVRAVVVPAPVPMSAPVGIERFVGPIPDPAPEVDALAALDSVISTHYLTIQADSLNTTAMLDLAFLYMEHDRFDRAIGPLARAHEIDPGNEVLSRTIAMAVARSGIVGYVDLYQAAREFAEMAAMWGEGC